jgi:hypothetical protein
MDDRTGRQRDEMEWAIEGLVVWKYCYIGIQE